VGVLGKSPGVWFLEGLDIQCKGKKMKLVAIWQRFQGHCNHSKNCNKNEHLKMNPNYECITYKRKTPKLDKKLQKVIIH
jgi:hypothetical protein